MKKSTIISLIALALSGFVSAQQAPAPSLGLYAAYFNADNLDNVYGGGVMLNVPLNDHVYVILRVAHYPGSEYSSKLGPTVVPVTADVDLTPIDLGLGLQIPLGNSSVVLYGDAGLTYMFADGRFMVNEFRSDSKVEDDFGWYAALGARVGEKVQGFVEVQFRTLTTDITSDTSTQINDYMKEIDLDHTVVNLGVRFSW